jgi:hypothetical protein
VKTHRPSRAYVSLVTSSAVLVGVLALGSPAAAAGDIGIKDFQYATSGHAQATYGKPESKLWFADGSWWAVMLPPGGLGPRIFELDRASEVWRNTGVKVDSRRTTRQDVLWDGTSLYVASHVYCNNCSNAGKPSNLSRYSLQNGSYVLDPGFPVPINDTSSETLVIEKDTTGTIWATWVQGPAGARVVNVAHTVGGDDRSWSVPFVPPVTGTSVGNDDISSLIRFGSAIGLMWSNQLTQSFDFSIHVDIADPSAWGPTEIALGGPGTKMADDHLNLKADASGRVFAAVKTSTSKATTPLIELLVRDGSGAWTAYAVSNYSQRETRPIVLLDATTQTIEIFMTGPPHGASGVDSGGQIYRKTSPMTPGAISFGSPDDPGTVVIADGTPNVGNNVNNVTSTKQDLAGLGGAVVLASNAQTMFYWHFDSAVAAAVPAP